MTLKLSECDYEYLRPPKDVFNVEHTEHYIRHGEGKKSIRKIFANVKIYDDEQKKLKEFEELISKEKVELPPDWTSVDTFRFMYSGKLDLKKSLKIMRQHLQWRTLPERGILTPSAKKFMEDGIVYISGRDKQYRPIIIINMYKVDLKIMNLKELIEALCFVLDVVRKCYFVPGKVENWIIFIEINNGGILDFPTKVLKTINDITSVNYTSTLDKLYILNPSSFLKKTWTFISSFIDSETASKISMVTKNEYPQLLEKISGDQLLEKYGGTLREKTYWPPENTLNQLLNTEDSHETKEINIGAPITNLEAQTSREILNEKNEKSKISTEDASRKNKTLENSNHNFAKSNAVQNGRENECAISQLKQEPQSSYEVIERDIPEPGHLDHKVEINREEKSFKNSPQHNSEQVENEIAVQEENAKTTLFKETHEVQSYKNYQYDSEALDGKISLNESKKDRNVYAKMDQGDKDKELNEEKNNGEVEINELNHGFTGKQSRSSREAGVLVQLDNEEKSIGFCGFCKPNNGSKETKNQNCNIF